MTIGTTHNHPADLAIEPSLPMQPWAARYPNPPDLCFDYRRLIEQEQGVHEPLSQTTGSALWVLVLPG